MKQIRQRNPPSITFITGQLGLGGAEKQLYLLAQGLIQRGWRVSVVTLNPDRQDYWEKPLRQLGIQLYAISTAPRLYRLAQISRVLEKEQSNIVHSWTLHANLYAALGGRLARIPIRIGSERANYDTSRRALGLWWYRWSLWGLDALVANSTSSADYVQRCRPGLATFMVPNGVDVHRATASHEVRDACRRQLGIPTSSFVIGAVGSLVQNKNFAALIESAGQVASRLPNVMLVLLGSGPLRIDLERQALASITHGKFLLAGSLPNAASWYPAFDLLCLPSIKEGMPNVLLEASAASLPVVATAVGGARQVVDDGLTGFLVAPNDVAAMTDRIEILARDEDLRVQMGQAGRDKMQREFAVGKMIDRFESIYGTRLQAKGVTKPANSRPNSTSRQRPATHQARVRTYFDETHLYLEKTFDIRTRALAVHELLGELVNTSMLDIGCGDGSISLQYAAPTNHLTLLDLSPNMLELAKQNAARLARGPVSYLNLDFIGHLPEVSFDVVLCLGLLAHLPSVTQAVTKLAALVKPRGRCIVQLTDRAQGITRLQTVIYSVYRRMAGPALLETNPLTFSDVVRLCARCGLQLVDQRRYGLMLPGMGRLPDDFLYHYQVRTLRNPWLSRHGSEIAALLVKM